MSTTPVGGLGVGKATVDTPETPMREGRTPPLVESMCKMQRQRLDLEESYIGGRLGKIYLSAGSSFLYTDQTAGRHSSPSAKLLPLDERSKEKEEVSVEMSESEGDVLEVPSSQEVAEGNEEQIERIIPKEATRKSDAQTDTAMLMYQQQIAEQKQKAKQLAEEAAAAKQRAGKATKGHQMTSDAVLAKELADQVKETENGIHDLVAKNQDKEKEERENQLKMLRQQAEQARVEHLKQRELEKQQQVEQMKLKQQLQ